MGFRDDIELILQATPKERQTVFFSATIPRPIQQLIEKYARNPQNVRMEQKALTVPTVEQVFYEVDRRYKIDLLTRLIDLHDLKLGIIFCNTKRMVDDLVDHLNAQGYSADRLHGDMTQNMRDRVMNKFRKSGLEFLVATDVAARGIDVEDIEVVFNFDLPYDGEDYVHRIGRTGRKGKTGLAISFASGREVFEIRNIERYTNTKITRGKPPTVGEVEEARANVVLDKIRATLKSGDFKRQDHLVERLLEEGFNSTDIASALLHQLQSGDGAPPKPSEEYERPERADERGHRGARHERPGDRRERPRSFERREERPPRYRKPAPDVLSSPEKREPTKLAPVPLKPHGDKIAQAPEFHAHPKPSEFKPPTKKKSSPPTPPNQTRLFMNIGAEMQITPIDIVNAIAGETGLPGKVVGIVDIRERHSFVDVAADHARAIIAKLNRGQIKGHKTKVKVA
jgi:ATP-dependent RNA helicase DeaD